MAGVPPSMRPEDVLDWLATEVVPSLDADTLMRLSTWVETHARLLEQSPTWLKVAARCAHLVDTPMETMGLVMAPSLQRLQRELDDLVYLESEHAVRFMLAEFSTLSCADVALRLLDRVPTADMLHDEIENHFRPYLERHNEDADVVLGEYAMEMVEEGTVYEDRAVAAIRAVCKPAERTRILLEVAVELRESQSTELAALMQETLEQSETTGTKGPKSSPLTTQLQQQHKLLELQQLVHRYGIRRYEVADPQQATAMLHHILSQTSLPSALADAERIAEFYHHLSPHAARVEYMQNHINEGNVAAALSTFSAMDIAHAKAVAHDVLSGLLEDLGSEESEEHQQHTVSAAIAVATALLEREGCTESPKAEAKYAVPTLGEAMSETTMESIEAMVAGLVTIQHLQKEGMYIGLRSLVSPSLREDALRTFVSNMGSRCTTSENGPSLTAVLSLADHLGTPRVTALRVVAMEVCNSQWHSLALEACKRLVERDTTAPTARTCCFVAAALLRQFHEQMDAWGIASRCDETLPDFVLSNSAGEAAQVIMLPTVLRELLGAALVICGDDNIAECLKLLGECETAEAVVAQCDMTDCEQSTESDGSTSGPADWRAHPSHYREDATVLVPAEALSALSAAHLEIEELEVKCLESRTFQRHLANDDDGAEHQIGTPHTEGLLVLLQRNGANQLALRVAARSSSTMAMVSPWQGARTAVETSSAALVSKALRARLVDGALAVGYMLECEFEKGHKPLLQLLAHSPHWPRTAALATVGMETATLQGMNSELAAYELFKRRAKLLARLADGGMHFDGVALRRFFTCEELEPSDIETVQSMVVPLLDICQSEIMTAFDFGQAFNLDLDMVRQKYVEYHMTSSTQDFKERILKVVDDMDPSQLVALVREILINKISPYDYARLNFAVRIMKHCDPSLATLCKRHSGILDLLSAYHRACAPTEEELKSSIDTKWAADKWAADRLPFQALINDPQSVVAPELCLEAVDRLLPLARCLELDVDQLHVTLAQQLAHGGAAATDVATAIKGIRKSSMKIETAESLAMLAEDVPTKVSGLQFALVLAQEWKVECDSDTTTEADEAVERLSKAVADASTQQLLTESGQQHLLDSAGTATDILYRLCDEHKPHNPAQPDSTDANLHKLFDEIATLHQLQPDETRHSIIKRWLLNGASAVSATVHATPSRRVSCLEVPEDAKAVAEEAAVRRIVFMMTRGDVVANARMLYLYAHSHDVTVPTRARAWALHALLVAASAGVGGLSLEALPSPIDELLERLQHLRHVEMLEELQIPVTLEELETCSKPGLVRSLWKERGGELGVAQLVSEMCLEYSVNDAQLWGEVLAKLSGTGDVPFLLKVLKRVMQLRCCTKIPKLAQIWQSATAAPLVALQAHDGTLSETACKTLSLAVDLACSCPLDPVPDMRPAVDTLLQSEQGELAIRCMLVITDTRKRVEALSMLLDAGLTVPILHQLPPYQTQPNTTIRGLQSLTRRVYEHMDENCAHLDMYNCSLGHQRAFLAFLLFKGTITNALKSLIGAGRIEDGFSLVAAVQGTSADVAGGLLPDQKVAKLQEYLTSQGSFAEAELLAQTA